MLLFLDLESTGINPEKDTILEISAVRFDGTQITESFDTLIRIPDELEIPRMISVLTGITKEMLDTEGIPFDEAKKKLEAFLRPDDIITGHNISFDTTFLKQNGVAVPQQEIDTFVLSTIILEQEESCALEILTEKYGLLHENAHRAMSDVLANLELWKFLQTEFLRQMTPELEAKVRSVLQKSDFSEKVFFEESLSLPKEKWRLKTFSPAEVSTKKEEISFEEPSKTLIAKLFEEKKKAVISVLQPEQTLFSILSGKEKMAVLFPKNSFRRFFGIFQRVKERFPEKKTLFLSAPESRIEKASFEKFLEKDTFSRLESIVGLKILFAMASDFAPDFGFSGDEWSTARELLNASAEFPPEIFDSHDLFFAPLSDVFSLPEDLPIVFFGAHEMEDSLTDILETRVYSKHLREDFLRYEEEKGENPFISEALSFFERFSLTLREKVGESTYPLTLPIDDSLWRESSFQPFLKRFSEFFGENAFSECPKDLQKAIAEWSVFSGEFRKQNEIFFFQVFPDNDFALVRVPIDISFAVERICERPSATLFLGSHFPREDDGRVSFSFSFPNGVEEYFFSAEATAFFDQKVFLPAGNGELSPKDVFPFLEALLHGESGDILFSVNSQKIAGTFEELLLDLCEHQGVKLLSHKSGSAGKIRSFLRREGRKLVIGTPKLLDDLHTEDFRFSVSLLLKFSFDPKGSPLLEARKKRFRNEFLEFAVPRARARFAKELFRVVKPNAPVFTLTFDARLGEKDGFGKSFQEVLPKGVSLQRISPKDIRTFFPSTISENAENPVFGTVEHEKAEQGKLF